MDLAENRFGKTWKHFLEALKVDYNCSLADVCRDQHPQHGYGKKITEKKNRIRIHTCFIQRQGK